MVNAQILDQASSHEISVRQKPGRKLVESSFFKQQAKQNIASTKQLASLNKDAINLDEQS